MDVFSLRLKADSRDIKKAEKDLTNLAKQSGKTEKSVNKLSSAFGSLASAAAVGATGAALYGITKRTEDFIANLTIMTGSLENAESAFDALNQFARETPYTLDQSINAFVKLKALGLDPSERAMRSYGNTASAMGKDLMQMIEAVADASTFEFERLKEFGIKTKQQGDQVSFTFRGVTTTVKKNSEEIQKYLMNIGETDFSGAMTTKMDTLTGKSSNLRQSFDDLLLSISKLVNYKEIAGSVFDFISSAVQRTTDIIKILDIELTSTAEVWAAVASGKISFFDAFGEDKIMILRQLNQEFGITSAALEMIDKQNKPLESSINSTSKALENQNTITIKTGATFSDYIQKQRELFKNNQAFVQQAIDMRQNNEITQAEFEKGLEGFGRMETQTKDLTEYQKMAAQGFRDFTDGIVDGLFEANQSFSDFAKNFLREMTKMIAKQMLFNALKSALGNTVVGDFLGFANGGVINNGNVQKFASGGIVNNPTFFPTRSGMGLMGEAGAEAIMPLTRGRNGKLGVEATGTGGGNIINQTINVSGAGDQQLAQALALTAKKATNDALSAVYTDFTRNGTLRGALA